jgi:hypothetical protein
VESKAQLMSPPVAASAVKPCSHVRVLLGSGKVSRLPRRELEDAGDEDNYPNLDRFSARQRRLL